MDIEGPAIAELMANVAATMSRRVAAVSENVYEVALRDIPELHDDQAVLSLLASSIHSNVGTCLQIMQHQIGLSDVRAPAAGAVTDAGGADRLVSLAADVSSGVSNDTAERNFR